MEKEYDVALSYAGEDRSYVDQVAVQLRELGVDVFYDSFFQTDLWGKDLYQYLNDLYKNRAIFTVVFISANYARKRWAQHELRSAQARAFSENYEYILPARLDSTEMPGLNETTGYLDVSKMSPEDLAQKIKEKLLGSEYFDNTKLRDIVFDSIPLTDGWNDTTAYFEYEFTRAFPELVRNRWYSDKSEIHQRLSLLLRNPTAVASGTGPDDPIWYFRGPRAAAVRRFRVIDKETCLLNYQELNIRKVYVHKSVAYWQNYLYVVVGPQEQTGVNAITEQEIAETKEKYGFFREYFGLYKGKQQYLTAEEVENGHYVANGKVHPIDEPSEVRSRFLTECSFFIAPKASPLNTRGAEMEEFVEQFCEQNVNNIMTIEQFNNIYTKLPRIDQRYG